MDNNDYRIVITYLEKFLEKGHPNFREYTSLEAREKYSVKEYLIYQSWLILTQGVK